MRRSTSTAGSGRSVGGAPGPSDRGQQTHAVLPDLAGERLARLMSLGQAGLLDPAAVALEPLRRRGASSQSGAATARAFRAARSVSATCSRRLRRRKRPQDMGRVGALPAARLQQPLRLAGRQQRLEQQCARLRRRARRARNSQSTEKWKPGSSSSRPSAYFQSIRARTASAAWRSESPSANCMTVTSASRHGLSAGRPRTANSR